MTIKTNNKTLFNIFDELKSQYGGDFDNSPLNVENWSPEYCGDIGLEIKKDGSWWQNGVRFSREKLIRLFCKILRHDVDGKDYLVTPFERILIKVEDAHFQIVRADLIDKGPNQKIILTPNYANSFEISPLNALWVVQTENGPRPYANVRNDLKGLINRSVYYDLVEMAQEYNSQFGVFSNGHFFCLGELNDQ